jgi:Lrp/AsnC family transcriptional regulator, regulator for asnA, asnC and gidA
LQVTYGSSPQSIPAIHQRQPYLAASRHPVACSVWHVWLWRKKRMNGFAMKLDDTDLSIIKRLGANGRIPNNEIASQLSVSEGTVRNRIKKLVDSGFLAVKGAINPELVKEKKIVFVCAKVAMSKDLVKVAEAVSRLPHVQSTFILAGRYDLMMELFIEPHDLIHFIGTELGTIDTIVNTETFMVLKSFNKWV